MYDPASTPSKRYRLSISINDCDRRSCASLQWHLQADFLLQSKAKVLRRSLIRRAMRDQSKSRDYRQGQPLSSTRLAHHVSIACLEVWIPLLTKADNEPEPKRKTLAERAGEPRSIVAPTPSSRPVVKGTSLVGAGVSIFISSNPFLCLARRLLSA